MLYSDHLREYVMLFGLKTEKNLKYTKKDATVIRKHCPNQGHTADVSCFPLVGNAANKYHLKLKESILNVAKVSMPLHLFENDLMIWFENISLILPW